MKNREARRHPENIEPEIRPLPPETSPRLGAADEQIRMATEVRQVLITGILTGMGIDLGDDAPMTWAVDTAKGIAIGTPKPPKTTAPVSEVRS